MGMVILHKLVCTLTAFLLLSCTTRLRVLVFTTNFMLSVCLMSIWWQRYTCVRRSRAKAVEYSTNAVRICGIETLQSGLPTPVSQRAAKKYTGSFLINNVLMFARSRRDRLRCSIFSYEKGLELTEVALRNSSKARHISYDLISDWQI